MSGTVRLQDLFEKYQDKIQFLSVYIKEAHPKDGWWLGGGITGLGLKIFGSKASTELYEAKNAAERHSAAEDCSAALNYSIPAVVDDLENSVEIAYAAFPTRLYLVGMDGRVAYAGGMGPWGFKPAELQQAVEEYIQTHL